MTELICHLKPYIQPFERVLALKELEVLAGAVPIPQTKNSPHEPLVYRVATPQSSTYLAEQLTYWEELYPEGNPFTRQLTRQVRREATANIVRNGILLEQLREMMPFVYDSRLPHRRNLRYGPHGIHEYRGKFFPQLVRSLLNMTEVDPTSKILDPMCGSGTTPVEAILLGCKAWGIDLNPLSVLMSKAKCAILGVPPERLLKEYQTLQAELLGYAPQSSNHLPWFAHLPVKDREYLSRWFASSVLAELDAIITRIQDIRDSACRMLFQVCFSNIIRRVSWQKDDDLRVRKAVQADTELDVKGEFLTKLTRSVKHVLAFLYENQDFQVGSATILEGKAQQAEQILADKAGTFDAIVTSPPYATALPYLDTDRLSLCYLGLLPRSNHRRRDYEMIGNREITNRQRQQYWEKYQQQRDILPDAITHVIDRIDDLNRDANVGFRRKNLPALLGWYFLDMRSVFATFLNLLKPGAPAYVVVGNNHTIAGGQRVEIETDTLLAQLGESVGLMLEDTISMEMLVSRDMFKANGGSSETIICFRNTSK